MVSLPDRPESFPEDEELLRELELLAELLVARQGWPEPWTGRTQEADREDSPRQRPPSEGWEIPPPEE